MSDSQFIHLADPPGDPSLHLHHLSFYCMSGSGMQLFLQFKFNFNLMISYMTPPGDPTFTPSFLLLLLSSCGIIPIDDRIWDATCYNLFSSILICQLTATFKFRKFRFRLIYPLDLLIVSGFQNISIDFGNCDIFIINKVILVQKWSAV